MKIAVLSDIHGNYIALQKCVEEIERRKIDKLIFLGDYVGELAYPQKTMAYLRKIIQNYECFLAIQRNPLFCVDIPIYAM